MWEYWLAASVTWLGGFLPWAGIHIAIPAAMATGMDKGSAVFWATFGNYTPLVLIHFAYEFAHRRLGEHKRVRPWLERFRTDRWRTRVARYGPWFVMLAIPWIGVWTIGISTKVVGMDTRPLLISGFVGLTAYALLLAYIAELGIDWLWG